MKFLDDILMKIILQNEIQSIVGSLGKAKSVCIHTEENQFKLIESENTVVLLL